MTIRGTVWLFLMTAAGVLSAGVTLYGIYLATVVDFRANTVQISLYCLLPILCFPVFLLVRPARRSAALLAVMAVAYLVVYSALDRRSCSELGYCGSIASTVLDTFRTYSVLAYFGAAVLSFMGVRVERRLPVSPQKK